LVVCPSRLLISNTPNDRTINQFYTFKIQPPPTSGQKISLNMPEATSFFSDITHLLPFVVLQASAPFHKVARLGPCQQIYQKTALSINESINRWINQST
jgi:hypothetical protein